MPKRILQGVVVSDTCDKTVVVRVERRVMHPVYKKFVSRSKKYAAHDEDNRYRIGDTVRIEESRPISKRKSWVVIGGPADAGAGRCRSAPATRRRRRAPGRERRMIQMQTNLDVADNSGARRVQCIKVLGGSKRKYRDGRRRHHRLGQGGDPARPGQEGRRAQAVIVRTAKEIRRADGSAIRFDRNAAVLITNQGEPIGTRIFGPVTRELRARSFMKIVSLAPEVL